MKVDAILIEIWNPHKMVAHDHTISFYYFYVQQYSLSWTFHTVPPFVSGAFLILKLYASPGLDTWSLISVTHSILHVYLFMSWPGSAFEMLYH